MTAAAASDRTTPRRRSPGPVVVAGIGNRYRRDDGAGLAVADGVARRRGDARDVGPAVDPLDLLGRWDGADLAVVIDAVRSGAEPGTLRIIDVAAPGPPETPTSGAPAGGGAGTSSTHGISLPDVLRLARAVGAAPERLVVVGIEGADFTAGEGFSPAVARAVPDAVERVLDIIGGGVPDVHQQTAAGGG